MGARNSTEKEGRREGGIGHKKEGTAAERGRARGGQVRQEEGCLLLCELTCHVCGWVGRMLRWADAAGEQRQEQEGGSSRGSSRRSSSRSRSREMEWNEDWKERKTKRLRRPASPPKTATSKLQTQHNTD